VGDKTIMFRLCDKEMYWGMGVNQENMVIDRGMALHKLIRLITATLGGEGYLTFMGNEFGHPEWIDFPREGNGWSYHHCRRQWSLAENKDLKFRYLKEFEGDMVKLIKKQKVMGAKDYQLMMHNDKKLMFYQKGNAYFAFNFHPMGSYEGLFLPVPEEGQYQVVMSTDDYCYGGHGRIHHNTYETVQNPDGRIGIKVYLPSRTAMVLTKKQSV
jgi:1,4-alpha-glucan branching enzyme